jgi:hypothetical protein
MVPAGEGGEKLARREVPVAVEPRAPLPPAQALEDFAILGIVSKKSNRPELQKTFKARLTT